MHQPASGALYRRRSSRSPRYSRKDTRWGDGTRSLGARSRSVVGGSCVRRHDVFHQVHTRAVLSEGECTCNQRAGLPVACPRVGLLWMPSRVHDDRTQATRCRAYLARLLQTCFRAPKLCRPLHGVTGSTAAGEKGRRGRTGRTGKNQAAELPCSKIKEQSAARPEGHGLSPRPPGRRRARAPGRGSGEGAT